MFAAVLFFNIYHLCMLKPASLLLMDEALYKEYGLPALQACS